MSYKFATSQFIPSSERVCPGSLSNNGTLTINYEQSSVTWYSAGGVRIVKQFKLTSRPLDAQFCSFEFYPETVRSSTSTNSAVAILLTNGDLHINLFTGELYQIHIPFTVKKMVAIAKGILFQRQTDGGQYDRLQCYWLSHPISPLSAVEFNESAFEVMNHADGLVLCAQDEMLMCYSPHSHSLSLLHLQPVTSAFGNAHTGDTSQDAFHTFGANNASLTNSATPMDIDRSTTSYRTPTVYSRENSPDIFNLSSIPGASSQMNQFQSSASAQAMFVGNDAALRSLLESQPVTPHTPHSPLTVTPTLRRGNSESLSASVRAQPLLYSRGTSGGSSNSNSAYHIRKKRAANACPSPSNSNSLAFNRTSHSSPRPSPSFFMFESASTRESLGSSDSPRSAGNNNSAAKSAGRASGHNDAGPLFSDGEAGPEVDITAGPPMPSPEVFLTCLAQVTLPEEIQRISSHDLKVTFCGDFDAVGGMFVTVFDNSTGSYYSYGINRDAKDNTSFETMEEDDNSDRKAYFIDTSHSESSMEYSMTLKYSYCATSGINATSGNIPGESLESLRGVAHICGPLESEAVCLLLQSACSGRGTRGGNGGGKSYSSTVPGALQTALVLPLTLLLTAQGTLLVLIGAQVVKEVPLQWIDDLADDSDCEVSTGEGAVAISTLHKDGVHFAVQFESGTRILSLLSLLGSSSIHNSPTMPFTTTSAHPLVDVIKALVPSLKLLNTEGLLECVLGFLLNVRAEVGSDLVLFWLLSASFGIEFKFFTKHYPSATPHKSSYLRQIYQVFSADAQRLYAASRDHCIANEVFTSVHAVLQDYLLRGMGGVKKTDSNGIASPVEALHRILRSTVHTVQAYHQNQPTAGMAQAYLGLLSTYGDYYLSDGAATRADLDSVSWCKEALRRLSNQENSAFVPDFPLPPALVPGSLLPCPTIRLTARFLEHLASSAKTVDEEVPVDCSVHASGMGAKTARHVLDAFVFSMHGVQVAPIDSVRDSITSSQLNASNTGHADFGAMVSYFPYALRLLIQVCIPQCQQQPNPLWPAYLLKLVNRKDLCGYDVNQDTLLALKKISTASATDASLSAKKTGTASAQRAGNNANKSESETQGTAASTSDGLAEVEAASQLRFTEDDRVHEVCRILRSSQPVYLKFEKAPEVSELDHRHKLQMKLLLLVRRSLACSVGRGMLTIASLEPLMAEVLPVPPLALTGRVPPANSIISLDTSAAPEELTLWPAFHNGVAAALRVGPSDSVSAGAGHSNSRSGKSGLGAKSKVTRNWIMYNRTASQAKPGGDSTHAGFLLGLGLLGHLTTLTVSDTYDYLVQSHEPTTIAVLIGSAASKLGTADPRLSKTISLHMPALLPSQHGDMDISPAVQTAAFTSLGLLHCGSGHRLMTEFLLTEMARSPSSDRCDCREAMVTAAAWALGMVLLGKGGGKDSTRSLRNSALNSEANAYTAPMTPGGPVPGAARTAAGVGLTKEEDVLRGLADLRVEDRLLQLIEGGKRPGESLLFPLHSSVDISSRSSRMLESSDVNTNLTAPGATIALALIFIRTNNPDILQRIALPTTMVALDAIRPDLLIYRAMATCLIGWDQVTPTAEWIKGNIPAPILKAVFPTETLRGASPTAPVDLNVLYQTSKKLDGRTALALYLSAVTGFCYGIGIVFAGTADSTAKATLLGHLKLLQSFRDNKPLLKMPFLIDKSLRHCVEMCLVLAALSLASVMAGSGDIDCLRTLRELRWKFEDVTFGTHMGLSMAIGMLFLGGGNFSLRRDPVSAACLLLSMMPRFPQRTVDNQYHLQALRHLYVLAAEPRALHTIDVDSGLTVSVRVQIELTDGRVLFMQAPGLLPELSTIRRISVASPENQNCDKSDEFAPLPTVQYYPTSIELQKKGDEANADLQDTGFMLRMNDSGPRCRTQEHISVPPLFVKAKPRAAYSNQQFAGQPGQIADAATGIVEGHGRRELHAQLQELNLPRTLKELYNPRSPVTAPDTDHTHGPAEKLGAMLCCTDGGENAVFTRHVDAVLGQALFENESFLQLVLQSVIS